MKLAEFLNGEAEADTGWRFRLSRRLNGAFGGSNGGVIAAAALSVARHATPGRVPAALDARFLRSLASGSSRIVPSVLHEGRTLSCVTLDVLDERGSATSIRIPFDEPGRLAEAACIAADIAVGPPVSRALAGQPRIPHPNPDLSLRFSGDGDPSAELVGCGRLEQISAGLAQTRVEVWSGDRLCAIGVSSSTLLAGAWPAASSDKP